MNRPPYFFCNEIAQSARVWQNIQKTYFTRQRTILATRRLKHLNYLAASCNYWGERDFLQEKVGSFIFLIANLFLNKFKKNLYHFTHKKIIFSII